MKARFSFRCLFFLLVIYMQGGCKEPEQVSEPGAAVTALCKRAQEICELQSPQHALAYADSVVAAMSLTPADMLAYYSLKYDLYHGFLHDNAQSLLYADSALALFASGKIAPKRDLMFRAYMHRANAYYGSEQYDKAFEDYAVAKEIAVAGGSPCDEFIYVYRIAMAYFREENYLASAHLFREAYDMSATCAKANDEIKFRQQESLSNTGLAYSNSKMTDSAIHYFFAALQFIDREARPDARKWDEARSVIYGNIGTLYAATQKLDSARSYFERAIALSERIQRNPADRQFTRLKLAGLLVQQGDVAHAKRLLDLYDSFDIVQRVRRRPGDNNEFDLRRASVYARYYEATGDVLSAMRLMKRYDTLRQRKQEFTNRIIKNDLKSGVDRKDHEKYIVSLEKDMRIKRLENVVLVLSLVIAGCIAAVIYNYLKKHRRRYQSLERKSEKMAAESAAKEAQLNAKIRRDELNFMALIENTDDFLWSVDERFKLLAFNKAYRDYYTLLTGVQPAVGEAEPLKSFDPAHYRQMMEGYAAAFVGHPTELTGKGLAKGDGAPDIKVRFRPIRTPDGAIVGVSCFRSDITEYLQLISSLERNNEQLRDIAWVQSHKLRGPVTTIMSIVTYLQNDDNDAEMRATVLGSLQEKLKEMDNIIHEIVSLTEA